MREQRPHSPLAGRRIVITRAAERAADLSERLRQAGAEPLLAPAIASIPTATPASLDAALDRLADFDWLILTSATTVAAISERLAARGRSISRPPHLRLAAVGPTTATAAARLFGPIDLVPAAAHAEGLLAAIGALAEQRILLPASDLARPLLADGLRQRGALVTVVTAYQTVAGAGLPQLAQLIAQGQIDALTFTSPSAVEQTCAGLAAAGLTLATHRRQSNRPAIICLGPVSAAAATQLGLPVEAVAAVPSAAGLVEALSAYFRHAPTTLPGRNAHDR